MATHEGTIGSYKANAALEVGRRVKLNGSTTNEVVVALAGEQFIGYTVNAAAAGGTVAVRFRNAPGTVVAEASGAITAGALVYGDGVGKITATVKGGPIGRAVQAAGADGAEIEIVDFGTDPEVYSIRYTATAGDDTANQVDFDTGWGIAPTGQLVVTIQNTSSVTRVPAGAVTFLTAADLGKVRVVDANLAVNEVINLSVRR